MKIAPKTAVPILLIVVFGLLTVSGIIPTEISGADSNPYLLYVVLQLLIFALPAIFFCTLRGGGYVSTLRIKMPSPSSIPMIISAAALLCVGSSLIGYLMCLAAPEAMSDTGVASSASFAMNSGLFDGLYLSLAVGLIPAITEEFLFRGIVLSEYGKYGVVCSVVISSLSFALIHSAPVRIPQYIFCALVLAIVTYATRSLIASVIVHFIYNLAVLFLEDYIYYLSDKQNISGTLFVIILAALTVILSSVLAFECASVYRTYAADNAEADYRPKKTEAFKSITESLMAPAYLIFIVMYVLAVLIL